MPKSAADGKAEKMPKTIPGQTPTARGSAQPHIFEQEAVGPPAKPSPSDASEIDAADLRPGDRSNAAKPGAAGNTK